MFLFFVSLIIASIIGNWVYDKIRDKLATEDESDIPENNLVELVGVDENDHGIYRFK